MLGATSQWPQRGLAATGIKYRCFEFCVLRFEFCVSSQEADCCVEEGTADAEHLLFSISRLTPL
jgi:hypothetical protein